MEKKHTVNALDRRLLAARDFAIAGITSLTDNHTALLRLFEGMPEHIGMAFIIIVDSGPVQQQTLLEQLSQVTVMPLSFAAAGSVIYPNHIYVLAADCPYVVTQGVLLAADDESLDKCSVLEHFFVSLAQDRAEQAIGILLDHNEIAVAEGFKAIKEAGGITFAAQTNAAAALAAGIIDFVLSPADIAEELLRLSYLCLLGNTAGGNSALFASRRDSLEKILEMLHKASGINFSEYKELTVKRRISRRMLMHKIEEIDDYVTFLMHNGAELAALQQDMLINVTQFFREPQVFANLQTVIFPSMLANIPAERSIRIWVPGCSTGEETYSLAITLVEAMEQSGIERSIQIFATDINDVVIDKARAGIYPVAIQNEVSPERLSRFFIEVEQGYQVRKTIRDICVFARQDLATDPPISRVDMISCRNVMIYFGPALHKRIFPVFHYALQRGGILLLGASESIGSFADLFELVDKKHRLYSKKAVAAPLAFDISTAEHAATIVNRRKTEDKGWHGGSWLDVQKEADRIVISKYAPPGVIINSKLDIIQFRGRTGAFLEPPSGMPSMNLLKMARDGLFLGLRSAINQAKKEKSTIKKEGLCIVKNGKSLLVDVDIIPLTGPFHKGAYFLVLFRERHAVRQFSSDAKAEQLSTADTGVYDGVAAAEILRLQQEIIATKEYLQSVIDQHEASNEDLKYANEEIQSSNEELQSMNEEMETAQEELQSTNEELMTLNEELRTRNMELNHINNDMINLLRSINVPVLILSNDLCIRRFNAATEKLFNLIGTDAGRPISNIKPNIHIADLEQACLTVLDTLNSLEQEVQDRWGHWYVMQIRPYRTIDNKIEGVIITFANIDALKKSIRVAQESHAYTQAILDMVQHPMVMLGKDLRIYKINKAFGRTLQITDEEAVGQSVLQIKDYALDTPVLRDTLQQVVEQERSFENVALCCTVAGLNRNVLLHVRPTQGTQAGVDGILLSLEVVDVSSCD